MSACAVVYWDSKEKFQNFVFCLNNNIVDCCFVYYFKREKGNVPREKKKSKIC